jgi:hypothetical protein
LCTKRTSQNSTPTVFCCVQERPPSPEELAADPAAAAAAVHRRIRRIADQAFWDARAQVNARRGVGFTAFHLFCKLKSGRAVHIGTLWLSRGRVTWFTFSRL